MKIMDVILFNQYLVNFKDIFPQREIYGIACLPVA